MSWAPVPNKPTVSVDVKQHFNQVKDSSSENEDFIYNIYCFVVVVVFDCHVLPGILPC